MELPAELAGGAVKAVDLDAIFGYAVRPDLRLRRGAEKRTTSPSSSPAATTP